MASEQGTDERQAEGQPEGAIGDTGRLEPSNEPNPFTELGLDAGLVRAVSALGYEEPTPIQREAIPPLLAGRDLLAEAPTGTGKTAAFALPLIQRIRRAAGAAVAAAEGGVPAEGSVRPADAGIRPAEAGNRPAEGWVRPAEGWVRPGRAPIMGLILVPTRELAIQVAEAVYAYGRDLGIRVLPVYGGQAIGSQLRALSRGVDVVVATPGRAVDHLRRTSMDLGGVRFVVLDEADEMLDMGFAEDLDAILTATPAGHQTALFSATLSHAISAIASRHLDDPVRVRVAAERTAAETPSRVRQVAYVVRGNEKLLALGRILDLEDATATLVFGRTRGEVEELAESLSSRGHDAGALHGGLAQEQRDRIMGRFRDGSLDVLVATDVAARGLDIEHVSHVVNYDVPSNPESYVHRTGRTGRAGREGVAITLVEPREHRLLRSIEAATGTRLEIGRLPTVADLRERRLEVLASTLREALLDDGRERYRGVVEALADEFDLVEIALAALSVADLAERKPEEEVELALATLPSPAAGQAGRFGGPVSGRFGPSGGRGGPGGFRGAPPAPMGGGFRVAPPAPGGFHGGPRFGPGGRPAPGGHPGPVGYPSQAGYPGPAGQPGYPGQVGHPGQGSRPTPGPHAEGGDWTTLWVGGGRRVGLRPGDLVGAIANEAGVSGNTIGAIRIDETYSLVDVKPETADAVVQALGAARIKGRKFFVRRAQEG